MLAITAKLLVAATGCPQRTAEILQGPLSDACVRFGIVTARRLADFLATIGHESQSFTRGSENLNYSTPERIIEVFRKFDLDGDRKADAQEIALARTFLHKPVELANYVYGGRGGNGVNEGYKYRGRGPIGLTFKDNYAEMRDGLRRAGVPGVPDFVVDPDAVSEPRWGAYVAALFWNLRGCNELSDAGDFRRITRQINGGYTNMQDREDRRARAIAALRSIA